MKEISKEERILNAVKFVLTSIAKETATQPGIKHPLSDQTVEDLRHCLLLISDRESEIKAARGQRSDDRPKIAAVQKTNSTKTEVVVPISKIKKKSD